MFLSEPRFEELVCVLETGSSDGAVGEQDIKLAGRLRRRGTAARARKTGDR